MLASTSYRPHGYHVCGLIDTQSEFPVINYFGCFQSMLWLRIDRINIVPAGNRLIFKLHHMLWLQYSSNYLLNIVIKSGKEEKNGTPKLTVCNIKSTGRNIVQQVDLVLG